MKQLIQLFYILFFYALGELLSVFIGRFIPGSVLGMILLFVALSGGIIKRDKVAGASTFLTTNMGLFFVPAGVGLMTQADVIRQYWLVILVVMVASTALVIAVVSRTQQRMEQIKRRPD